MKAQIFTLLLLVSLFLACSNKHKPNDPNPQMVYRAYEPELTDQRIDRNTYLDRLQRFWLWQCIANWSRPDHPNIWNPGKVSWNSNLWKWQIQRGSSFQKPVLQWLFGIGY